MIIILDNFYLFFILFYDFMSHVIYDDMSYSDFFNNL